MSHRNVAESSGSRELGIGKMGQGCHAAWTLGVRLEIGGGLCCVGFFVVLRCVVLCIAWEHGEMERPRAGADHVGRRYSRTGWDKNLSIACILLEGL